MERAVVEQSAAVLASVSDPEAALSVVARARAAAFLQPERRDDFVAARVLAARLVADHLRTDSIEVSFAQVCGECGGPHGRPQVVSHPRLHVSWSHDHGWVAAAVSDQSCGVDVVHVAWLRASGYPEDSLSLREREWCAAAEDPAREFARLWARKEALVKCGRGSLDGLAEVDVLDEVAHVVDLPTPSADVVAALARHPATCRDPSNTPAMMQG